MSVPRERADFQEGRKRGDESRLTSSPRMLALMR